MVFFQVGRDVVVALARGRLLGQLQAGPDPMDVLQGLADARLGLLVVGPPDVGLLLGDRTTTGQLRVAIGLGLGQPLCGLRLAIPGDRPPEPGDLVLHVRHRRHQLVPVGLGGGDRRSAHGQRLVERLPGRLEGRPGLGHPDAPHRVVEDDQQVALADEVVVIDPDLAHILSDPGRRVGDVGVDVSVVGRGRRQRDADPRVEEVRQRGDQTHDHQADEQASRPRAARRRPWLGGCGRPGCFGRRGRPGSRGRWSRCLGVHGAIDLRPWDRDRSGGIPRRGDPRDAKTGIGIALSLEDAWASWSGVIFPMISCDARGASASRTIPASGTFSLPVPGLPRTPTVLGTSGGTHLLVTTFAKMRPTHDPRLGAHPQAREPGPNPEAPSPRTNQPSLPAEDSQGEQQGRHWERQVLRRGLRDGGLQPFHQHHRRVRSTPPCDPRRVGPWSRPRRARRIALGSVGANTSAVSDGTCASTLGSVGAAVSTVAAGSNTSVLGSVGALFPPLRRRLRPRHRVRSSSPHLPS